MATPATPFVMQAAMRLAWDHNCLGKGCGAEACELCRHCCSRRCSSNLKGKYVSGDYIHANCGAEPVVRLVDATGRPISQLPPGWKLQVCMLDNRKYSELAGHSQGLRNDQLATCLITDRPMLIWEAGAACTCVTLSLQAGIASLSGLRCAKPSKADESNKQSGQTTKYRLLLTVTQPPLGSNHQLQVTPITPLVSEAFTLVTTRSKGAVKSDVPLPDEDVSMLEGVGKDAVKALRSLSLPGLPSDLRTVDQVGKFWQLVAWVNEAADPKARQLQLVTAIGMKLSDYKKAAEHVQRTAFPDLRPRVWWAQGSGRGLLFACKNAEVQFDAPLGWVVRAGPGLPDAVTALEAVHLPGQQPVQPAVQQAVQVAVQSWLQPQHGNSWGIYWADLADPLAQMALGASNGMFSVHQLPAGVMAAALAAAALPVSGSMVPLPPAATAMAAAAGPEAVTAAPAFAVSAPAASAAAAYVPVAQSMCSMGPSGFAPAVPACMPAATAAVMPAQMSLPLQGTPAALLPQQQLSMFTPQGPVQQQVALTPQLQSQLISWHIAQLQLLQQQQLALSQQQQQQQAQLTPVLSQHCALQLPVQQHWQMSPCSSVAASVASVEQPTMQSAAAAAVVVDQQQQCDAFAAAGTQQQFAVRSASLDMELAMQLEMEQVLQQGLLDSNDLDAFFPELELQQQQQQSNQSQQDQQCADRASSLDLDLALGLAVEEFLGQDMCVEAAAAAALLDCEQKEAAAPAVPVVQEDCQQQPPTEALQHEASELQQGEEDGAFFHYAGVNDDMFEAFPASLVGWNAGCVDMETDLLCGDGLAAVFGDKLSESEMARLNDAMAMSY